MKPLFFEKQNLFSSLKKKTAASYWSIERPEILLARLGCCWLNSTRWGAGCWPKWTGFFVETLKKRERERERERERISSTTHNNGGKMRVPILNDDADGVAPRRHLRLSVSFFFIRNRNTWVDRNRVWFLAVGVGFPKFATTNWFGFPKLITLHRNGYP